MALHHTTFVLPATASGLPHDVPFLVLGAETADEVGTIPAVTSLHRINNAAVLFRHASPVLGEVPVSDAWARVVEQQYDDRAKVVILREPVPADVSTQYAELTEGVLGPDLPPWLGMMLSNQLYAYTRDVPVTSGEDPLSVGMDPTAPTTFPEWAHRIIDPAAER